MSAPAPPPVMTSRALIRWASLHERRARPAGALASPLVIALVAGAALAGWIAWRGGAAAAPASRAHLAGALVAFGLAFMRVPFHLYWRADAALLAQLPIPGAALLDAALWRCARAAAATTLAVALGALPLARISGDLAARHLALTGALGLCAALLLPAVALAAAAVVAAGQSERIALLRRAAGIDGDPPRPADAATPPAPSTAMLGALPGFVAMAVFSLVLLGAGWLRAAPADVPGDAVVGGLAAASVVALLATRRSAPDVMGTILRDVSALDRQRLATLEIRPPTGLEQAIARLVGAGALAYRKDARLMRRRYPMAYALGFLALLVLGVTGLARPADPMPWLLGTLGAATIYGLALGGRVARPPIELPRLTATLPIAAAAVRRAKLAWVAGWWAIYVAAPGVFAALRQPRPLDSLALVGAATLVVLGGAALRR